MSHEKLELFSTIVTVVDFEGEVFEQCQKEIAGHLDRLRAACQENPVSPATKTTFHPSRNHDIDNFRLEGLARMLVEALGEYAGDLRYTGPGLRLAESWTNFHTKGGFQFEHVHPGTRVHGVYYYQTNGEDGDLQFTHPVSQMNMGQFPYDGMVPPLANIQPKVGRLVLFPAWLSHKVLPNLTDDERISISFNYI